MDKQIVGDACRVTEDNLIIASQGVMIVQGVELWPLGIDAESRVKSVDTIRDQWFIVACVIYNNMYM